MPASLLRAASRVLNPLRFSLACLQRSWGAFNFAAAAVDVAAAVAAAAVIVFAKRRTD